jgi:hypothetical protein
VSVRCNTRGKDSAKSDIAGAKPNIAGAKPNIAGAKPNKCFSGNFPENFLKNSQKSQKVKNRDFIFRRILFLDGLSV